MGRFKLGESGVWWHEKNLGPLEKTPQLRQFGSMKFSKVMLDDNMRPHLNDGIEIHFIESGKFDWVIENKRIELFPDDISITAPWHLNGSPSGKMDMGQINWIILKPENFGPSVNLKLGKFFSMPESFQHELGKLISEEEGIVLRKAKAFKKYFLEIRKELTESREGYDVMVMNLLENLLIDLHRHLINRKQQIQSEGSFIDQLKKMVCNDLAHKWNVIELAEALGMGKTNFTERVKRITGYPPNSFIINLRLDKAKQMMQENPSCNLSDIAYSCGFSSLQHFTSSFSQRTGTSPAKFFSRLDSHLQGRSKS